MVLRTRWFHDDDDCRTLYSKAASERVSAEADISSAVEAGATRTMMMMLLTGFVLHASKVSLKNCLVREQPVSDEWVRRGARPLTSHEYCYQFGLDSFFRRFKFLCDAGAETG